MMHATHTQLVSCKVAAWQQQAQRTAEVIKTGTQVRLINPSLVPANRTFSMGATSEVELRITPDTVIEVTNDNVDPTDSSL